MTLNDVEQDMTSARLLSYSFESLPFPGTHKELIDKLYSNTIREGRRLSGNVTHDAGNRMMKHEKGYRPCKYNDIRFHGEQYTIRTIDAAPHSIRMASSLLSLSNYIQVLHFKGVNALDG
jgi:hypothetical protein